MQPDFSTGAPGSPLVNGASQAGNALTIDGLTAGYGYRAGQMVSVIVSSRRFVHQVRASGRANGSGQATIAIEPALRVTPADNGTVEIGRPFIEGLLDEAPGWAFDVDTLVRGFAFAITEAR